MLEEYCTSHLEQVLQNGIDPWSKLDLHPTAQSFLDKLDLPSVNPYCTTPFHLSSVAMDMNESFAISNSSLGSSTLDELDLTMNDSFSESWSLLYPSLLMVVDLSFRLFASIIAPISIAYLLSAGVEGLFSISATSSASLFPRKAATNVNQKRKRQTALVDFIVCFAGLLSSTVILTDAMYVHHYGRVYGFSVFLTMVVLASQCAFRAKRARGFIVGLIAAFTLLVGSLIFHSEGEASVHQGFNSNGREFIVSYMKGSTIIKHQPIPSTTANDDSYPHPGIDLPPLHITEGLHYSQSNPIIHSIVNKWPEEKRSYDVNAGATPYTITGDARTGVPFLVKLFSAESITYNRVFLEVEDGEVVALDIALPQSPSGQLYHDYNKPVYLVLHGLNGGSNAPFIREFALRRNEEGSTVIVMIGRGLMDMPIRGM
uniref:Uncharacterized protein n=1 Tax=Ditylum brightwellii TaxID=49249 RepID=A0A6V2CHE5_9STRA